jgi:hypothetical protein
MTTERHDFGEPAAGAADTPELQLKESQKRNALFPITEQCHFFSEPPDVQSH